MTIEKAITKFGVVTGAIRDGYSLFKGIPYASPPTIMLRLAAPIDPEAWTGKKVCTEWPLVSIQEQHEWPPRTNVAGKWIGSEDCLYLNIWTPAQSTNERLPVIFWIHGGGFAGGSSFGRDTDGAQWSKQGVILVTVGYRLGALGFLGLRELTNRDGHGTTGNYGLMDILKALRWVKDNIAVFGGNPENITIAGQSSGAMSVKWLLGCTEAKGLFQHAIAQSGGGTWDIDPILTQEEKCDYSQKALDLLGWTLKDVMAKDAVEVCSALTTIIPKLGLPQRSMVTNLFQPSQDGWLVTDYYGKIIYDGDTFDVDVMCGTIREEWRNFPYQVPGGISGFEHEFALAPGIAWARRYVELGKRPIYHYFFDHDLPGENGEPRHGSEMQYTFGTFENNTRPWTDYDRLISITAVNYWTNFAKTGNPNTSDLPNWQPFTTEHPFSMHFANDGIRSKNLGCAKKVDKVVRYLLKNPGILDKPFFN